MNILNLVKENVKASIVVAIVVSMGISFAYESEEDKKIAEVKRIAEYDYLRDNIITNAKSTIFKTNECIKEVEAEYKKDIESVPCSLRSYNVTTAPEASGATSTMGGATTPQP